MKLNIKKATGNIEQLPIKKLYSIHI